MSLKAKTVPLFVLLASMAMAAGSYVGPEGASEAMVKVPHAAPTTEEVAEIVEPIEQVVEEDEAEAAEAAEAADDEAPAAGSTKWASYSNVCETFTVLEGEKLAKNKEGEKKYPVRYRRNRYDRKRSHQQRTRELIRLVAAEMGADEEGQYVIDMMAFHESTWNPEAIHILNGDLAANRGAWERHTYTEARETALLEKLRKTDARTGKFWDIKAELADLWLYKNNPYWDTQLEYTRQIPERTIKGETYAAQEWKEYRSVWAFGYGLYGMNAVLFTHVLARDAPPWILCSDEGIEATVAAIWALREQQTTCQYLSRSQPDKYGTDGGSLRSIVRRWGAGQCKRGNPGPAWHRVLAYVGATAAKNDVTLTWETMPSFGDKFPQYEMVKKRGKWKFKKDANGRKIRTDPEMVFAHMRDAAAKAGLMREQPLQRKDPTTAPVIVARR